VIGALLRGKPERATLFNYRSDPISEWSKVDPRQARRRVPLIRPLEFEVEFFEGLPLLLLEFSEKGPLTIRQAEISMYVPNLVQDPRASGG